MVMMSSSNGNIFCVTGPWAGNSPVTGEFPGHRWIPLTKASDAELRSFLWYALEPTANDRDAGDLRRHRSHYDAIVVKMDMFSSVQFILFIIVTSMIHITIYSIHHIIHTKPSPCICSTYMVLHSSFGILMSAVWSKPCMFLGHYYWHFLFC